MSTTDFRTPGELSQLAYTALTERETALAADLVAEAAAAYAATLTPSQRLALRNEYARMARAGAGRFTRAAQRRAA